MITEDRTWELFDLYLDGDFKVWPMAPDKSSEQSLHDLERKFGINFPVEYKAHILGEGDDVLGCRGVYVEVLEGIWPRPKPLEVAPFWSFLYGLHTYSASKESEDWMRLEVVGEEFMSGTGLTAIPILKIIGDADVYCIDENSKIGVYRHEENVIEEVHMTFWEVLEQELKALRERKDRKIKESHR